MTENTQDRAGKFVVACKCECENCAMIVPVLQQIASHEIPLTVYTQDDPDFPEGVSGLIDDTGLEHSCRLDVETLPTLIRFENNRESDRVTGWDREQ